MPEMLQALSAKLQERPKWVASLFGGGASFLGAAACAAQGAAPGAAMHAALVVLATGVGSALLNEFHQSHHESKDSEQAKRNHLVRRGMAQALHDALQNGEGDLKELLPPDLRNDFFENWLPRLRRAAAQDPELLDTLFPPQELSEEQWRILNRYEIEIDPQWLNTQPAEAAKRIQDREERDQEALARLLRNFPELPDEDEPIQLFRQSLARRWSEPEAKEFAARLLPLYRTAFGCVFSAGGPESKAIEYKGVRFTQKRLEEIQDLLQIEFKGLKEQITRTVNAARDELKEHISETAIAASRSLEVKLDELQDKADEILAKIDEQAGPQTPEFVYCLERMETVFGRKLQMDEAQDKWLASPTRQLLVFGPPGIGKSTFARCILRDLILEERFGARRYELQCDAMTSAEDLIARMATEWFGLFDEKPERLPEVLRTRFRKEPCAILIDNFETLMRSTDVEVRKKSQHWLAELANIETLWMIVGVQGHELPASMAWEVSVEPEPLSEEDALDLFCSWSKMPGHAQDQRLSPLLDAVERVPHAVKLLGGIARGHDDLDTLLALWQKKGIGAILRGAARSREESLEVAYEFAIQCLDEDASKALRVLAWLPAGVAKADIDTVLPDGLQVESALYNAALVKREGSPFRLRMLKPLRDYVARVHPAGSEGDSAMEHYLHLASEFRDPWVAHTGQSIRRFSEEFANAIVAFNAASEARSPAAIDAARGLGRFSALAGIGRADSTKALSIACKQAEKDGDDCGKAWCLRGLGEIARYEDRYDEADERYLEALPLFHATGDKGGEAWCLLGRGDIARLKGIYSEADKLYLEAIPLFPDARHKGGEAACLWGMGDTARFQDRYAEAGDYYARGLLLFQDVNDKRGEASCLRGRGECARLLFRYVDAVGLYEKAILLFQDANDRDGEGLCLRCLGDIAREQRDYPAAESIYKEALPLLRSAYDKRAEGLCLWGLGEIAREQKDYPAAEKLYKVANSHFVDTRYEHGKAWCCWSRGEIAREQDKDGDAEGFISEALQFSLKAMHKRSTARCYESFGEIALKRGQPDAASGHWIQARDLYRVASDEESAARIQNKLDAL